MLKAAKSAGKIPLELWQKLDILVEKDGKAGQYITRVEEIHDDYLVASRPGLNSGKNILTNNCSVYLQFLKPDALYRISAVFQESRATDMVRFVRLGELKRVQRREFVRIDLKYDIKYCVIKQDGVFLDENHRFWYDSQTVNVSAGGVFMKIEDNIKKDDIIMIRMEKYADIGIPRLLSAVCCRIVNIKEGKFAGVQFITSDKIKQHFSSGEISSIPQQVTRFTQTFQNKMVNYIFDEQVRQRQKGIL